MGIDKVDVLIEQAHSIFNETSVYEVIDLENEQAARSYLKKKYNNPDENSITQYLEVIDRLKKL